MAEASTTNDFRMNGAREALSAGLVHIEQQIISIEDAVAKNPGLTFDLAKTLIESVCKTILDERNVPFDAKDDLPKLFRLTTRSLPFLPISAAGEAEVRHSLARTLGGLHTAVQGVCELRNSCGFASHGTDRPRPALETVQALLAAESADAVVGFLHRSHRQDRLPTSDRRLRYEDNPEFNASVDEMHRRIVIFDEEFQPSKVLFDLAPEPYRLYLAAQNMEGSEEEPMVVDAGGADGPHE
jgi:hypothetical protein